jgi:hypothetical protein
MKEKPDRYHKKDESLELKSDRRAVIASALVSIRGVKDVDISISESVLRALLTIFLM